MTGIGYIIRLLTPADRQWVAHRIAESWGAETVVVHRRPIGGTVFHPAELPGFVAEVGEEIVGLLTYHIEGQECEIVTLDSWREGLGVGSALIEAMTQAARQAGCRRLWLITTNDNTHPALLSETGIRHRRRAYQCNRKIPTAEAGNPADGHGWHPHPG